MSLMEKLAEIAARKASPEYQEYAEGINKIASDVLGQMAEKYDEDNTLSKEAEEAMTKLSEEEKSEIREYVAYGRGVARGEEIGKEAGYLAGVDHGIKLAYDAAMEADGERRANELYGEILKKAGITEEDVAKEQELEQVQNDIAEAAAAQLIEAAGGEDNITPEQAEEFKQIAETAGEIGVQQLLESDEDGGEGEDTGKVNQEGKDGGAPTK